MIQPSRLQEIMPGARFGSAYPSHHQFLHYADTTAFSAPVIGIPVTKAQEFQFFRQDNNSLSWLFNEGAYEGLKSEDNSFLEDSEKSFYGNGGVLYNPRDLTLDVGSSPAHSPDSSGQSIPEDLAVDKIDSINSNLSFSSSSTLTESSTGTAKEMVHNALTAPMESKETRIDREILLMRYREKKKRRKFQKQIRYESRKAYADKRPRIKGRFVKRLDSDDHCPASVSQSNSTRFDLHWVYS